MEAGFDFLSKENIKNTYTDIKKYMQKNARDIKIKSVKFAVSGVIIAAIPFLSVMNAFAAGDKYSMSYLYAGTTAQQISYVNRTQNSLNTVSPSYFDINADGSLKLNIYGTDLITSMHTQNIKVVPFISNHWDRQAGIKALENYEKLASQIAEYVRQYNLDGVNVDIENVTEKQRDLYTAFVASLRAKIPAHKEVSVAVAANPNGWTAGWHGSYDYAKLAQHADYLMIMAYDEHYEGGGAGPVASVGWVESSIKYALKYVPKNKIVLGVPFFGRVWSGDGAFNGKGVDMNKALTLISAYNANITYDSSAASPKAEFTVTANSATNNIGGKTLTPGKYTLWYENEKSVEQKLKLVQKYDLKGAGSWSLGQESASVWNNYTAALNGIVSTLPQTPTESKPLTSTTSQPSSNKGTSTASSKAASQTKKPASSQTSSASRPTQNSGTASKISGNTSSNVSSTITGGQEGENPTESNFPAGYKTVDELENDFIEQTKAEDIQNVIAETPVLDEPSPGAFVLDILSKGAAVAVLGSIGAYFRIRYKKREGYIRRESIGAK